MVTTKRFGIVTEEDLERFTIEDLITIYNELRHPPIRDFASKEAAIEAVAPIVRGDAPPKGKFCPWANLPVLREVPRPPRPGTNLAYLAEALLRGATWEECEAISGKKTRQYMTKYLHRLKGFGLRQAKDRKIYLLTRKENVCDGNS
jgi:hypothetical protein